MKKPALYLQLIVTELIRKKIKKELILSRNRALMGIIGILNIKEIIWK